MHNPNKEILMYFWKQNQIYICIFFLNISVTYSNITQMADMIYDGLTDSLNSTNSTSSDCTNEYCVSDEDYLAMIEEYIYPSTYEWLLISLHITVFIVGLIGNALVCVSVYHNHTMRTVTNYFIVNLAVADFLVILICLPPTVLWDVTKTWFFGSITCKLVLYLQVRYSYFVFNY